MLEVLPYRSPDKEQFMKMLGQYFNEDLQIKLDTKQVSELFEEIILDTQKHRLFIDLLVLDKSSIGFCIWQIDEGSNPWCLKEGWGFIREFYVSGSYQSRGYGRYLFSYVKEKLEDLKVPGIYLTSDEAGDFWLAMGLQYNGEICEANNCEIYEMNL